MYQLQTNPTKLTNQPNDSNQTKRTNQTNQKDQKPKINSKSTESIINDSIDDKIRNQLN